MQDNIGRESAKDNDLFFTCSLIDYIARKTKNTRIDVVNTLGKKRIEKIYDLADVYHSDNIDRVSDDFIVEPGMKEGNFDNYEECQTVLRYLALKEMNLVIEKNDNSQITSIEIPAFLVKR